LRCAITPGRNHGLDFPPGFILVGLIATSSALIFWRLPADAGAEMADRLPAAGRASDPKGG